MPTYTYRCQKCGHEFERVQSMSDAPVKRCPECKGKVQRVIHPVGIVLKGSGFHRNDYRSPSKSGDAEGGTPGDKAGSGTKSDAKPEKADKTSDKSSGKPASDGSAPAPKAAEGKRSAGPKSD